jgi:hypothetical protein
MPRIRTADCVMHTGRLARDHRVDDLRDVTVRLPIDREHDLAQNRVFAFRLPEIGDIFLNHLTLSAHGDLVDDADHQGNRASKALDKAFEKVIAPAGLFELPTI